VNSRRRIIILALAAVGVIALALGATITIVTLASQQPTVPSDAPLFVYGAKGLLQEDGHQWEWNADAKASLNASDSQEAIVCPPGSSNVAAFVASFGEERTPASWTMWEFFGYNGTATSSVKLAPLTPDRMGSGAGQAVHKDGGTFSLGVACTTNDNLDVTAAYYRTIRVQPGGIWALDSIK
jgi:hypothetical protein